MTTEFILRLFIASILGGAIGLEREYRAKEAGFRTHFLVALGSALFMILSQYGFDAVLGQLNHASFDPSRIASQVVTGIGFIGAGTIIFQKHVVRGLTTAAGLWVTSAIGLTVGSGMYLLAVSATILVLLCLEMLHWVMRRFGLRNIAVNFSAASMEKINAVLERLKENGAQIEDYRMKEKKAHDGTTFYDVSMELKIRRSQYNNELTEFLKEFDDTTILNIE